MSKTCILKVSLGRDAFALSGGSGNCHLKKIRYVCVGASWSLCHGTSWT